MTATPQPTHGNGFVILDMPAQPRFEIGDCSAVNGKMAHEIVASDVTEYDQGVDDLTATLKRLEGLL